MFVVSISSSDYVFSPGPTTALKTHVSLKREKSGISSVRVFRTGIWSKKEHHCEDDGRSWVAAEDGHQAVPEEGEEGGWGEGEGGWGEGEGGFEGGEGDEREE